MTTSINFPVHTRLNPEGKWQKLEKNGTVYTLLNPTTKQKRQLGTHRDLLDALRAVVDPLLT